MLQVSQGETYGIENRHAVVLRHPRFPKPRQEWSQFGKVICDETCPSVFRVGLRWRSDRAEIAPRDVADLEALLFDGGDLIQ